MGMQKIFFYKYIIPDLVIQNLPSVRQGFWCVTLKNYSSKWWNKNMNLEAMQDI